MAKFNLMRTDSPEQVGDSERIPINLGALVPPVRRSRMPFRLLATAINTLFGRMPHRPARGGLQAPTFEMVRRGIMRELNRTRRFNRPLSLLVLRTDVLKANMLDVGAFITLQRLRDTDLWFHDPEAGELVVLAPETGSEAANILGQRLAAGLGTDLSIAVAWSTAVFPVDGLTFEALYDVAEARVTAPAFEWVADARGHA